jgi:hypothetical protein
MRRHGGSRDMLAGIAEQAEWIVFILILANQAGIPVFAAPALLGVGALAANGDVSVVVAVTVAVCAALCADLAWYGLGRCRGTWALTTLRRLSGNTSLFVDDAQRLFLAHDHAFSSARVFCQSSTRSRRPWPERPGSDSSALSWARPRARPSGRVPGSAWDTRSGANGTAAGGVSPSSLRSWLGQRLPR